MEERRINEKSLHGFAAWLRENEKSAALGRQVTSRRTTKKPPTGGVQRNRYSVVNGIAGDTTKQENYPKKTTQNQTFSIFASERVIVIYAKQG